MARSFQELLHRAGRDPNQIPARLLCLDPGHTLGYATFLNGVPHKVGQLPNVHLDPLKMSGLLTRFNPTLVVFESFRLYPWRLQQQSWSEVETIQVIGALKLLCQERNIPTHQQSASAAKTFVTDQKLKDWNMWIVGKRHSRDAVRHGCYYLLFSKQS